MKRVHFEKCEKQVKQRAPQENSLPQAVPKRKVVLVPKADKETCLTEAQAQKVYEVLETKGFEEVDCDTTEFLDMTGLNDDLHKIGIADSDGVPESHVDTDSDNTDNDSLDYTHDDIPEDAVYILGDSLFPDLFGSQDDEVDYDYLLEGWNTAVNSAKESDDHESVIDEDNDYSDPLADDHAEIRTESEAGLWSILSDNPTYPRDHPDDSVQILKKYSHKTKKYLGKCTVETTDTQ